MKNKRITNNHLIKKNIRYRKSLTKLFFDSKLDIKELSSISNYIKSIDEKDGK